MPAASFQLRLEGLAEAKAAFQRLPDVTRDKLTDAVDVTAQEIVRNAKARIQSSPSIVTGTLLNHIGYSLNRKTGIARIGVIRGTTVVMVNGVRKRIRGVVLPGKGGSALASQGAKVLTPTKYAHLVEFGHARGAGHAAAAPEPFLLPSAEAERPYFLERCRQAGRQIENAMTGGGLT
jgi:hypothetical protein